MSFVPTQDYYDVLEIEPTATVDMIKKAYRALSLKYHPDKNPDVDSTAQFQIIGRAYEVLSDSELRLDYDEKYARYKRQQESQPQPPPEPDYSHDLHQYEGWASSSYQTREPEVPPIRWGDVPRPAFLRKAAGERGLTPEEFRTLLAYRRDGSALQLQLNLANAIHKQVETGVLEAKIGNYHSEFMGCHLSTAEDRVVTAELAVRTNANKIAWLTQLREDRLRLNHYPNQAEWEAVDEFKAIKQQYLDREMANAERVRREETLREQMRYTRQFS